MLFDIARSGLFLNLNIIFIFKFFDIVSSWNIIKLVVYSNIKNNITFVYTLHITGVLIYQAMLIISYFILLFFIHSTMEFI